MRRSVTGKQENASMCFVCGLQNPAGLKAAFFELENGELMGLFNSGEQHQSYPGRLHGGLAATILDETMGRVINVSEKGVWGVTVDLQIRYRKPVPLSEELRVVGRIIRKSGRSYEAEGQIVLADGTAAVEGSGRYMILPADKITDVPMDGENWRVVPADGDPLEVEVPD